MELLYRFLIQCSQSDSDQVQDWTQRSFIKAFKNLGKFSGQSSFKTWLFSIGLNEMRADLRSNWKFETYDHTLHHNNDFSDPIIDDWMTARVAVKELPSDQRMVFLLYEVEGYNHKEIGDMLGISESYSRVILTRAKKDLKEKLEQ